ncbi:TPR-like protein [Tilletiaria anomala UBC 951]|uniref:TPR-like protein n=1 Tax=Tilletiaria anomala (strain ATCC 24038 / CBS 436.72 / UBC 951) TaxID=1037660 RepID=A0A066WJ96_TILAU|nr:TPR-like protein [Tilletiaria anomala UBC 951]KDN52633.1 TPR-like protein [Tilletiaria anomala UBC 951]
MAPRGRYESVKARPPSKESSSTDQDYFSFGAVDAAQAGLSGTSSMPLQPPPPWGQVQEDSAISASARLLEMQQSAAQAEKLSGRPLPGAEGREQDAIYMAHSDEEEDEDSDEYEYDDVDGEIFMAQSDDSDDEYLPPERPKSTQRKHGAYTQSADAPPVVGLEELDELDLAFQGGNAATTRHYNVTVEEGSLKASRLDTDQWLSEALSKQPYQPEEVEVDVDAFKAFVGNVQQQGTASINLDEDDDDDQRRLFERELAASRGFGKRKTRNLARVKQYSDEVNHLLRQGHAAYAEGDPEAAIHSFNEVIRIEPTIFEAWQVLGLVYDMIGEQEKGLQAKILAGHLVATRAPHWIDLGRDSYQLGLLVQAEHCFHEAMKADKDNLVAMFDRATILNMLNQQVRASRLLAHYLERRPYEAEAVRNYIPCLTAIGERAKALDYLEHMKDWNLTTFPDPLRPIPAQIVPANYPREPTFGAEEAATMADFYLQFGNASKTVEVIKQSMRWLQGRSQEIFWDSVHDDDREFDERRPQEGTEHRMGTYSRRIQTSPPHGMDPVLRVYLGKARLRMGNNKEANMHFDLALEAEATPDILAAWRYAADACKDLGEWEKALVMYSALADSPESNTSEIWALVGKCQVELGQYEIARQTLEETVEIDANAVDAKLDLARVLQYFKDTKRAMKLVVEVIEERRKQQAASGEPPTEEFEMLNSFFDETRQYHDQQRSASTKFKISRQDREKMMAAKEAEVLLYFRATKLMEYDVFVEGWWRPEVKMDAEHDVIVAEYLNKAGKLIDTFKDTKRLFPGDRSKRFKGLTTEPRRNRRKQSGYINDRTGELLSSLRSELSAGIADDGTLDDATSQEGATHAMGVHLDEWIDLFMKYAFVLTKTGDGDSARETLDLLSQSNAIWTYEDRRLALELCKTATALYDRDPAQTFVGLRFLTGAYAFHEEPHRLWNSVSNHLGFYGMGEAMNNEHRRQIKRRNKLIEQISLGKAHAFNVTHKAWVDPSHRKSVREGEDATEDDSSEGENEEALIEMRKRARAAKGRQGPLPKKSHLLKAGGYPSQPSAVGMALEACGLLSTDSYQGALGAALRTLDKVPTDALLMMIAGISSIGRASNRQVDNRHYMIIQGLAMLSESMKLSNLEGTAISHYNIARALHHVSLAHLAIPHYERCLELHDQHQGSNEQPFDVTREAAFNLANLYTTTGGSRRAMHLYRRYLTV